jgi:CheY-like chemotaxis protein
MQKMRARLPEIKIIIISGMTEPKTLRDLENAGADIFFTKPVPMSDFLGSVEQLLGLARTVLQSPKIQEEETQTSLADLLVDLRTSLNAESVFLLDSLGHVQAETGQLPDENHRTSFIASLMGMHNAAEKAASILKKSKYHLHLFDCDDHDLVFLPLGRAHVLGVIGKGLADLGSIASTIDALYASQAHILGFLEEIGVVEPVKEPEAAPEEEPELAGVPAFLEAVTIPLEFDELLQKATAASVDANAFWDQAIEEGPKYTEPDKLTYEQAMQLGLAPKSEDKP